MADRKVHTIDATKTPLGRLSSNVARLLMGKHKPSYSPEKDEGDFVVVENFDKVKITGDKMVQKQYYRKTKTPGKLSAESMGHLWNRDSGKVLQKSVMGMLPKNTLRKKMIKRLTIVK